MPKPTHPVPTLADNLDLDEAAHTPGGKAVKRVLHLLGRATLPTTASAIQASCEFSLERVLSVLAVLEAKGLASLNARGDAVFAIAPDEQTTVARTAAA